MLFMSTTWACETGLPSKTRIPGFRDSVLPVTSGTGSDIIYSSTPSAGQRNQHQSQGTTQALSVTQAGQRGQSVGRGQGHGSQAGTSR